ncbi:MAG: VWA domain-containing protein [Chloroflexota bacterium]
MDNRVVEFIRGLRAAGVRVSMAESVDALKAVESLGIQDRDVFRTSLRATLVKEEEDIAAFEELFTIYFGSGGPPLMNAMDDMSPDEQQMLEAALSAMSGRLQNLMEWLTSGDGPTKEELEEMARRAGVQWANNPQEARWVSRRMLQQMGFAHLEEQVQQLVQQLQEMGMSQEAIEKLLGVVEANREALAEQVAQNVGKQIAENRAEMPDDLHGSDLMNKPFQSLREEDLTELRREVSRLVMQMRTRAALRRKKGRLGKFDAKGTIRQNQRYGGVPIELKFKRQKLKPSLVVICDMSRSMYHVTEFLLRLIYELQDQVSKTRSFAFYSDMEEVSDILSQNRPEDAAEEVFKVFYRGGPAHYATDLGRSMQTFYDKWLNSIDGRTSVVILGDGRNNFNNPRTDLMKDIQRRARRFVWLCPEHQREWGTGDSDMWHYYPIPDSVSVVRNMAQLSSAIDKLIVDG